MGGHYDEETGIETRYYLFTEGIEVDFDGCPGATVSLYAGYSAARVAQHTTIGCPKVLHWTPPKLNLPGSDVDVRDFFQCFLGEEYLEDFLVIEPWEDGYMRREVLVTEEEANEKASQAVYDERDEAHIAFTRKVSVGTSTVWLKIKRERYYRSYVRLDVSFCVKFANSEECTRFLHEDIRKLKDRIYVSDGGVINDIMRALEPIFDDLETAQDKAAERGIPFSQFEDEYPQPEKKLIFHPDSNRGDDRPCFLTLHLSISELDGIDRVDWSATNIPPTVPSPSGAFWALNNIHFNFPSSTPHDCPSHDRPSQNSADHLTFTVEATGIRGLTATNSVAQGNSITIKSEHRSVNVNLAGLQGVSLNINFNSGDTYSGPISGGNVGGRNNVNTFCRTSPARFSFASSGVLCASQAHSSSA